MLFLMNAKHDCIITVGRQFGSGGSSTGRALAAAFGMGFYDRKLIDEAARHSGIAPRFFERRDEQAPSFLGSLMSFGIDFSGYGMQAAQSKLSDEEIYRLQADVIKDIASRGPAVIVGRSADYALRDRHDAVHIFLHAPVEYRIKNVIGRGDASSHSEARAMIEKADKARAAFYNFYTDKKWGVASSYDLCLDSSLLTADRLVEIVHNYLVARGL